MSPLRDSDLTPALRARLRAAGVDVRARAATKVSRREGSTAGSRVRCHTCHLAGVDVVGELLPIERHVRDEHHGGRIEDLAATED